MSDPVYDARTMELLARSEQILNKSQMVNELCSIQSKKVAALIEGSIEVIDNHIKILEEQKKSLREESE